MDLLVFDELQSETEKLLALLQDRQEGLASWWKMIHCRLDNIRRILDNK